MPLLHHYLYLWELLSSLHTPLQISRGCSYELALPLTSSPSFCLSSYFIGCMMGIIDSPGSMQETSTIGLS